MPPFRFKLQPVLDQRQREERDAQSELARLQLERARIENAIRTHQRNIEREQRELVEALGSGGGGVDLRSAKLQSSAAMRNRFDAQRRVLELRGLMDRIERARRALAHAATRRKAVEMLRDQQREAHRSAESAREARDLDDLSVMRFAHATPYEQEMER